MDRQTEGGSKGGTRKRERGREGGGVTTLQADSPLVSIHSHPKGSGVCSYSQGWNQGQG